MSTKAVAFLKAGELVGYELACSRCPIVLRLRHDRLEVLPQHRCNGKAEDFDIVLETESLVFREGRIDTSLPKELSRTQPHLPEYQ